jgi:hypothetical protein
MNKDKELETRNILKDNPDILKLARKEILEKIFNDKFIIELISSVDGCYCSEHKEIFIQLLKSLEEKK